MSDRWHDAPPPELRPGLPHSIEAEMSVVGGMFLDADAAGKALAIVEEWMFFRDANRRIFRAMRRLWDDRQEIDTITLPEQLRAAGDFETIGGTAYLAQILDAVPTAANIEYHARIVRDKAARRRLIEAADAIRDRALTASDDSPDALIAEAGKLFGDAVPRKEGSGLVDVGDLLPEMLEHIEDLTRRPDIPIGIKTGLHAVDDMLGPMVSGQLVLVAARPSMGKSAWAICNLAADAAIRQAKRVAVFSVESTKREVMMRLIGSEGVVNMARARKLREFTDDEYPRMVHAAGVLKRAPLSIDHTPGLTVDQLRVELRRFVRARGSVDLVVVDYLQKMTWPGARDMREEVSRIGSGLKSIASEFDCVVVALSQLSRAVESRPDKRPMMSDLRESGTLEQDADVVMMLFRPEYYFGKTMKMGRGKEARERDVEGLGEVILAKVRDGETGSAMVGFEKAYTHFRDLRS